MRAIRHWLMAAALCLPVWAHAMTAIFYQPQLRDMDVPVERWPAIFATARAQGADTLVIQWGRYGDVFDDNRGRAWLAARARDADAAGLQLILGLAADPDFFDRQLQPATVLATYFRRLSTDDARVARWWRDELGDERITGWYLPAEIDDKRWRDDDARAALGIYAHRVVAALAQVAPRPVYVSSFFAGNMAPARYADMLAGLSATGLRVWVQDGAGTAALTPAERQIYLDAALTGQTLSAQGVVFELFRQQSGEEGAFRATPRSADEAAALLRQRAPSGADTVFFSLRYLPALGGALPY
ncbi:MAG: DUF4434 domain-containing protein [Rhodocyclaceae bacterium]